MSDERRPEADRADVTHGRSSALGASPSELPTHHSSLMTHHSATEHYWTTLSRRLVYENPWIAVHEDQVLRPDGQPGIYGVVQFKNRAIGVLPVDEDGGIWLVGQFRYPLGRYSWEIPEGGCPEGESPEE